MKDVIIAILLMGFVCIMLGYTVGYHTGYEKGVDKAYSDLGWKSANE